MSRTRSLALAIIAVMLVLATECCGDDGSVGGLLIVEPRDASVDADDAG